MDSNNPYSAPQTHPQVHDNLDQSNSVELTPTALTSIISAQSWMKFIAFTLIFIAILFICVIVNISEATRHFPITGILVAMGICCVITPIVIAIFMYNYSGKAKLYTTTQTDSQFSHFITSHNKLYITLVSGCIVSILTFSFFIYYSISKAQERAREYRNNRTTHSQLDY